MKERIAKFIRESAYKPMTFEELSLAMGVPEKQHVQLRKTLEQMEVAGEVVQTRLQRYGAPERMNLAVGRLQGHPKGFGFLVQDDPEAEDVFVGRESLNGAWHGDRIIVRLSPPTRPGGKVEGEVIRILHRATTRVVGTFEAAKHAGYVTPDDPRLADDVFIPRGATNGAKSGEKVVVQIVTYPESRRNAEGKIVERIGMKGAVGVDIVSVIRKFGLPEVFPQRVLAETEPIPETVPEEAAREEGRRDLRGWTIVTIDGEDAKDLDDAVNVERIGNGVWRLGVHIADVSYYVAEGSQLDREAYTRATSVYLADRVVPMLPPKLSNGICSLNPHVDRLTLSCVMEIDSHGKILRYEVFPSVIKTVARMTYTKVNEILAGDEAALAEYRNLVPTFREMHALQEVLRERRMRRGALDFDLPEAKVKLNEAGWPIEIRRTNRGIAERIIEEFMLAANETVAEHCHRQAAPFMYRVHGEPAGDRLAGLRDFLALFGYTLKLPGDGGVPAKLLQSITDWVRGRPEENLINQVLLRTMRQAVYSAENFGHFGLAADYYCHFTSPIRRYPDLVVHRVLRALMSGELNAKLKAKWQRWIPDAAQHSSDRERVAMEAERETIDLKKAEYMSERIGETFDGQISGVGTFGFFVQLPNTVEGLVHISSLTDDYYHFHDNYYALIGERTRRRFRLGDAVKVRVGRVDVDNRQVDFLLEVTESPVVTVAAVPGETRQRSERKRSLMGLGPKPAEREAGREGGRGRKAQPAGRQGQQQPPQPQPQPQQREEGARTGGKRRRKGKRGNDQAAETGLAIAVAPAPMPRPVAKPRAAEPTPGFVTAAKPRARQTRKEQEHPVRVRPGNRVDMWGVPVPEGRSRKAIDDDPTVTNPYALTPAPRDGGGRGGSGRAFTEAPFAPAPGTADESAGLPGVVDGGGQRRKRPIRRRPRSKTEE